MSDDLGQQFEVMEQKHVPLKMNTAFILSQKLTHSGNGRTILWKVAAEKLRKFIPKRRFFHVSQTALNIIQRPLNRLDFSQPNRMLDPKLR